MPAKSGCEKLSPFGRVTRDSYKAVIQLFRPAGLPIQALNDIGRSRQLRFGPPSCGLNGPAQDRNSEAIINGVLQVLFTSDVPLSGLDRSVPKQEPNLFEFAAAIMAEACTSAAIMPHSA